jgi:hypothetical protein
MAKSIFVLSFLVLLTTAFVFGQSVEEQLKSLKIPCNKISADEIQVTMENNTYPFFYNSLDIRGKVFWSGRLIRNTPVVLSQNKYNVKLKKDTFVYFETNKKFQGGTLAEQAVISNLVIRDGFTLNISGKLLSAMLVRPTVVNGIKYKDEIRFKFLGGINEVKSGLLAEDTTIGNIKFPADSKVSFFDRVKALENVLLSRDLNINGITFAPDKKGLYFYESGKVKWGRLANATVINGKSYKAMWLLMFDESGRVQKVYDESGKEIRV